MNNLFEQYECKIDAKGRVLLPALLKRELSSFLADGFVLKRSIMGGYLELYTMNEWTKVLSEITKKSRFNKKAEVFRRQFIMGAKKINLDSVGRMLIPRDLVDAAGIVKDLVLSGTGRNMIEIWDKDNFYASNNLSVEELGDLAEELFGDDSPVL